MIYTTQERSEYLNDEERVRYNKNTREAIWNVIEHDYNKLVQAIVRPVIAVIKYPKRKVLYYDSGGGDGKACFKLLEWFLRAQAKRWGASVPEGFNADEWSALLDLDGSWGFERVETPTQRNCLDCGPFTLGFASYITKCIEEHFPFSQDDITAIRKRITYDLMYAMREL